MKGLIATILTLCLLCGAVALADTTIDQTTTYGDTELTLIVGETFTLTIPTTLTIALSDTPTNLPLTVSDYNLASNHQLAVTASTQGNGNIYLNGNYTDYTGTHIIQLMLVHPENGNWPGTNNPIYFTANDTKNIGLQLGDWSKAEPGTYIDTATIKASIVDK